MLEKKKVQNEAKKGNSSRAQLRRKQRAVLSSEELDVLFAVSCEGLLPTQVPLPRGPELPGSPAPER